MERHKSIYTKNNLTNWICVQFPVILMNRVENWRGLRVHYNILIYCSIVAIYLNFIHWKLSVRFILCRLDRKRIIAEIDSLLYFQYALIYLIKSAHNRPTILFDEFKFVRINFYLPSFLCLILNSLVASYS